jgi:hypothetical protein
MNQINYQAFLKSALDVLRDGDSKLDGIIAINEVLRLITLKLIENRITDYEEMKIGDDKLPIGNDCKFTNLYEAYCSPKRLLEDIKTEQFNSNLNLSENKLKPYHHQTLYDMLYRGCLI